MGWTQTIGFAEAVEDGLALDQALRYQLFSNHFPPLPGGALDIAKKAIHLWKAGLYKANLDISSIAVSRTHGSVVPLSAILEEWHLFPFVASEDDEYIWEDWDELEEHDGDKIYNRATKMRALLIEADIVPDEQKPGLFYTLLNYCAGYSYNVPGDLHKFGLVTDLAAATKAWKTV